MPLIPTIYPDSPYDFSVLQDAMKPDQLIAGGHRAISVDATIARGMMLGRGYVLGQVTATGIYKIAVKTATDGSQVPVAIAADNAYVADGDVQGAVYCMGKFDGNAIGYDPSFTHAQVVAALGAANIYLTDPTPSTDAS